MEACGFQSKPKVTVKKNPDPLLALLLANFIEKKKEENK